jgi:UPF0755 protein
MNDSRRDQLGSDSGALSTRLTSPGRLPPKSPSEALQPEPVPPPPLRSRAVRHPLVVFLNFVLTIVIVIGVAGGALLFFGRMQFDRPGALDQSRTISIERGTNLGAIADQLQREGAISSKWLFIAGVWMNKQQNALKAGEYLIPAHASMHDVMEVIASGTGVPYKITIPEGLTTQQIIDRIKANDVLVGDVGEPPPEGSLLPETYSFTRGDTRQNMINRMMRERDRVLTDVWSRRSPNLPLTSLDQLVILASIVEKETALADERPRIAAVFINRLRLNMRLQSDPTVIYAKFGGAGRPDGYKLTSDDVKTESAYNTYTVDGLPPGPIANPGRASLEAVANPSRTKDLFFVALADGSGGHAFAETYDDHLRNVARFRQNRAAEAAAAAAPDPGAAADAPSANGSDAPPAPALRAASKPGKSSGATPPVPIQKPAQ